MGAFMTARLDCRGRSGGAVGGKRKAKTLKKEQQDLASYLLAKKAVIKRIKSTAVESCDASSDGR